MNARKKARDDKIDSRDLQDGQDPSLGRLDDSPRGGEKKKKHHRVSQGREEKTVKLVKQVVTAVRLPESDRDYLAKCGTALYLSFPKTAQPRNASQIRALRELVSPKTKAGEAVKKVLPSGHSYIAVIYSTAAARDAALKILATEMVTHKTIKSHIIRPSQRLHFSLNLNRQDTP